MAYSSIEFGNFPQCLLRLLIEVPWGDILHDLTEDYTEGE